MTRFLVALLLLAAVPTVRSGDPALPSLADITGRLDSGDPLVFATFGDSITFPCFHTDFRQNYITLTVDALRQAHPRANVRIIHAGNMGTTARGLAETRYQRYVLDHQPDVVFLMFGMNDCRAREDGLEEFDRNLTQLIARTRDAGALPIILTQNEVLYGSPDFTDPPALPQYMERALEVATREQALAVDCFADWRPLAQDRAALISRLNDRIHPNLAGHRLFAKSITAALWPDATRFVDTTVRPPPTAEGVPCLLPGPSGKQLLRTHDGVWLAISGRRRGNHISDLVLSSASGEEPAWSDFTHITLVGPTSDALFPDDARDVTAGMLCEHEGLLFVFYSWNTGVYYLSLDLTAPGWHETIATATSWKDFDADPFPRPTPIKHSRIGDGRLYDAIADRTARIVLCHDRFLAPGGGWEVVDGEDGVSLVLDTGESQTQDTFLFPSSVFAQFGMANGNFYVVGQQSTGAAPVVGLWSGERQPLQLPGPYQLSMPHLVDRGYALATPVDGDAQPANSKPLAIVWNDASDVETHEIDAIAPNQFPVPVTLGDKPAILLTDRDAAGHAPSIAYESRLRADATTAAAVVDREGLLEFRRLPVRPIRMQP